MKKHTIRIWVSSAVLLALSAGSALIGKGKSDKSTDSGKMIVSVATDATYPPMEYINENKEIVGFAIDVFNAIAKAADFEIDVRNAAWDGIFAGLAGGNYDAVISSVTITEERKQAMDFSMPYLNAGQILVVPEATNNILTLNDAKGMNVGAQIGTTGAFAIQKVEGVVIKTYDEIGLAMADLANGKLAAVVTDTPIATDFALTNPKYKETLKIAGEPFTEEYYGIAVKKGNQELLELINRGLNSIKTSGELDQLIAKWIR